MKKRIYLTFVFIVIIFSLTGCRFPSQFTIYYYPNYKDHPEKTGINWIEIAEEDENDNFIRIFDI